ncbi:hypothetical protein BX616_002062 [Lobosporangium transversale]|uniref:Uncharacterized protein n=1 Tax=Lobosporangium transversale TaxID=64571 RepID=A0A1Y2GYM8_9FUNG|nr:hypothetical protein BCR41DRAFT_392734 [Lobosporangium transversale]KAF9902031.1 hypothetical protein BX616_002062 [Lobosporangium transversale]ORZ27408.1 hypothetical protein BCR41DRAFT_392734 [Lobosporangium transversale]|eukprot:XP_021885135.1 hypothetical protein BCR41DRAFT_392734 [Lobosporangium transversale]
MKGKGLSTIPIPDIKEELEKIKVFLDEFHRWIDDYLSKLVISPHGTSINEAKTLTIEFLGCLVRYSTETLPDFYMVVDQIRALMIRYEHTLEVFISGANDTISSLQVLIDLVSFFRQEHIETAKVFLNISLRAQRLIDKYKAASHDHTQSTKKYGIAGATGLGIASAGLGAFAFVTMPYSPLAIVLGATRPVLTGTTHTTLTGAIHAALTGTTQAAVLAAVFAGAGSICSLSVSAHNRDEARVYSLGATNMQELDRCSKEIKESIFEIGNKLSACKNLLEGVKSQSKPITAGMYSEDTQREEYRLAKGKTVEMKELCDSVDGHLNEPVVSLYATTTSEVKVLMNDFLGFLVKYPTETVPDLYRVLDRIQALMTRHKDTFVVFIDEAENTISPLHGLIDLDALHDHTESAKEYRIAAAAVGTLAFVVTNRPLAIATWTIKVAVLTAAAAGVGGIGGNCCLLAYNDETMDRIYNLGAINMQELDRCSKEIEESIFEIGIKLDACRELLEGVKNHSKLSTAGMYSEDIQKEEYKVAKGKAVEMKELSVYRNKRLSLSIVGQIVLIVSEE